MQEFEIEFAPTQEIEIDISDKVIEVKPPLVNLEVNPSSEKQVFNHDGEYGYDEVVVNAVETEELNITPTKETQSFSGMYNKVEVGAVTSEIDSNIVADNIKSGVEILGVTGNFVGGKYKPRAIRFGGYTGDELDYEIANLDTSLMTSMEHMFSSCRVKNLDLSGFDTSKVTSFYAFLRQCSRLKTLNLSNFDTSKATTMQEMFYMCNTLTELDVSSFDTSNVTRMYQMFYDCRNVAEFNLTNFNTAKVVNMGYMFRDCYYTTKFDLSSFNTALVQDMSYMFQTCQTVTSINLSNFTSEALTNISNMFYGCSKLESVNISGMEGLKVTNTSNMFYNCKVIKHIDMRKFDFSKVTSYNNMFYNVPVDCEIIVKDDTAKAWVLARQSSLTNVKTVAELGE